MWNKYFNWAKRLWSELKLIRSSWILSIVADYSVVSSIIMSNKLHTIKRKRDEHWSKKAITHLINKFKNRFQKY